MKNLLYISGYQILKNSPVGVRMEQWINYFKLNSNLYIIGSMPQNSFSFINKVKGYLERRISRFVGIRKVSFTSFRIKKILKRERIDIIFVQTLPFRNYYLCEYIKQNYPDIILVLDMSDPLVINSEFSKMPKRIQNSLREIELKLLKYIDYLIVLNDEIKNYYLDIDYPPKNIIVIEQGAKEIKSTILRSNNEKLSLVYAGSFYKNLRDPFKLYNAVNHMTPLVILNLYCNFKKNPFFLPTFKTPFIKCYEPVDHQYINNIYFQNDVVVFIDNEDNYQVPGKLFEILVTKKPMLFIYTNNNSPSLKYVSKLEGIFITKNIEDNIIRALKELLVFDNTNMKRNTECYMWDFLFKRMNFLLK